MRVATAMLVWALCAGAGWGQERVKEVLVDDSAPLVENRAQFNYPAGPVTLKEIVVKNAPSEREIREGTTRAHPKPVIHIANNGDQTAHILVTVILEDDQGTPLLKCTKTTKVDEGEQDDTQTLCWLESMPAGDYAKVKTVHLVGRVSPRH